MSDPKTQPSFGITDSCMHLVHVGAPTVVEALRNLADTLELLRWGVYTIDLHFADDLDDGLVTVGAFVEVVD